ncbi:MAG TPA: hypothetical protein VE987_20675 [Polyangiaceae bacterium]|nr:hypothetical protein [Polyangiaceae bacterium]
MPQAAGRGSRSRRRARPWVCAVWTSLAVGCTETPSDIPPCVLPSDQCTGSDAALDADSAPADASPPTDAPPADSPPD